MQTVRTAKACLSLFRIQVSEELQYRLAALSGVSIGLFWAMIEIVVYTVFFTYGNSPEDISGLSLAQTVAYVWIAQALFSMQPMGNLDEEILEKITNGDVALELCRPLDLYMHWFTRIASRRLSALCLRGVIILGVGFLLPARWGLSLPASLSGFAAFLVSTASAFLLCSAYGTLACVIRLGIPWGNGPLYMFLLIGNVLSGSYLPLQLWPEALQTFLLIQPFAGYLDIPARLYIGSMPPTMAPQAILLQLGWTASFIVLGRHLMRRKLRGIIIQGG